MIAGVCGAYEDVGRKLALNVKIPLLQGRHRRVVVNAVDVAANARQSALGAALKVVETKWEWIGKVRRRSDAIESGDIGILDKKTGFGTSKNALESRLVVDAVTAAQNGFGVQLVGEADAWTRVLARGCLLYTSRCV